MDDINIDIGKRSRYRYEHGLQKVGIRSRVIYAEFPSYSGFGVGGQPHSNFLASTVKGVGLL